MPSRILVFLFLYGATALVGFFLTFFWTRFAYRRAKLIRHHVMHDRAFVLALAIAFIAGGLTLVDGARTYGNTEYGLSAILQRDEAYFIGAGLVLSMIGLLKMAWLADLETDPPRWWWLRIMIGATVLWAVIAILICPGVPYGG